MDVEFDWMGNIISISNVNMCQRSKLVSIRKGENNACTNPTRLSFDNNIRLNTINIVELFKEKNLDKNLLPYYDSIDDISNPKALHKNAEKITDVWKYVSQNYDKNLNGLTKEESSSYLIDHHHTINQYKRLLAKYESSDNSLLINFDENDVIEMEGYFKSNLENHRKIFGDITTTITSTTIDNVNDNNNNEEDIIDNDNDDNNIDNDGKDENDVSGESEDISDEENSKVFNKYHISNEPGSKNSNLKLIMFLLKI
ncbi:hypothetical protein BCR36DRAFT_92153 [Piromyces finnis]|uniref:Uncharacterized protein n=1 Tax=Piromyces finnis TaxID=1754191 RepID=A0A1Y1VLP1_9FUNG|nr:hypothetical protein BCR36DRAFT_92153 [Piromyces finnis]|eukprot:ORX59362.1 hypothetical protein BCR36DRAFT_92153 [Piromyces finnis]